MADFTGKVGLIVGVANHRSLAWAIAQACAKGGATLILTYQGRFEEHVGELAEKLTPKPTVLPLDVSNDDEITAVFAKIQELHGGLDFVVHGAAFASRDEIKFSAKVAAALRNQFGGHAVKAVESAKAGQDPR